MAPSFRADHVGSLLRPTDLISLRPTEKLMFYTPNPPEGLRISTEDAITTAVQIQHILDIYPITDGNYSRATFCHGFFERLGGFQTYAELPLPDAFRTNYPPSLMLLKAGRHTGSAAVAESKIKHKGSVFPENWNFLRAQVPESDWKNCKLTMPSIAHRRFGLKPGTGPQQMHTARMRSILQILLLPTDKRSKHSMCWIKKHSVRRSTAHFFPRGGFQKRVCDEDDPEELLETYIWATIEVLKDKPQDMNIGVHLCRGNFPGSYEWFAERLFSKLNYDTFYLEFDTTRAGDFSPRRYIPIGKNVVLGLVSTKAPELEDLDVLKMKVHEAAEVIAHGQNRSEEDVLADTLAVSPQCGFSSVCFAGGLGMTQDIMWKKLLLVQNLANKIWG